MDSPQPVRAKPVVITADSFNKKSLFKYSIVNPKFLGLLTVLLLMIGGIGAGVYSIQVPQQTTTQASIAPVDLSLQPSQTTVPVGTEFNVEIFASANQNQITSVNLAVEYNPQILELKSITPGQFLPKVLIEPSLASGSASISLGTDGNSGITGNGVLANLIFRLVADSASPTSINFDSRETTVNVLGSEADVKGNLGNTTIKILSALPQNPKPVESSTDAGQLTSEFDFNGDSQINSIDLTLIYNAWGNPETEGQEKADINKDGVVNGLDYSLFLPKFQR